MGIQRVFTEDGTLDETMTVENHDVVLVPRGHHPCAVPYGYEMYYLNVMAGPLRKWPVFKIIQIIVGLLKKKLFSSLILRPINH